MRAGIFSSIGGTWPAVYALLLSVSMLLTSPDKNNEARNAENTAIALTAAMDNSLGKKSSAVFPSFMSLVYRKRG